MLVSADTQDITTDVGQAKHLALVSVTADTTDFEEEVNATAITITGTATTFVKAVGADTITIGNGALLTTFAEAFTDEAGSGNAAVTINDAAEAR